MEIRFPMVICVATVMSALSAKVAPMSANPCEPVVGGVSGGAVVHVAAKVVLAEICKPIWTLVGFGTELPVTSHLSKTHPGLGTARKSITIPLMKIRRRRDWEKTLKTERKRRIDGGELFMPE